MSVAMLYDIHGNLTALQAVRVPSGHRHTQFERTIAGVLVVNPGRAGKPYEDEAGACRTLDLAHRRTPFEGATGPRAGRDAAIENFETVAVGA